eukprot:418256_1
MIDEQILLNLSVPFVHKTDIVEWLKCFYRALYLKISKNRTIDVQSKRIALLIAAKIRLIFKNDGSSIQITDQELITRVLQRITEFTNTQSLQCEWIHIQNYRYSYNQHIAAHSNLVKNVQIGKTTKTRICYKISRKYSILTHHAALRHQNRESARHTVSNKQNQRVNATGRPFKIGKG